MWYFAAITVESEVDLQSLVAKFRKCKEFKVNHPCGVTAEFVYQSIKQSGNILAKEGIDNYTCSSWCWFPFYEANFGWGKPSWVSIRSTEFKNTIILMDASVPRVSSHLTTLSLLRRRTMAVSAELTIIPSTTRVGWIGTGVMG